MKSCRLILLCQLLLPLLLPSLPGSAQKIEKYYDYQWRETEPQYARLYAVVEKTDSGWRRKSYFLQKGTLQLQAYYEDSACKIASGTFLSLHPTKEIEWVGRYVHNKKQGLWLRFYQDGKPMDSAVFDNGRQTGIGIGWHHNGYMSDSSVTLPDGSGVRVSWFDNGVPSSTGRVAEYKMDGKWTYFHRNGKPSSIELYDHGKFVDKQFFNEKGNLVADTSNNDKPATFPGGLVAWGKFLSKHLFFPPEYKINNSDKASVVITCTADEEGRIQDAYVSVPFFPEFDKIALDAVRQSPRWIPAMNHNRKVKATFRQPVIFSQYE
jgi:antitoxin component YwqK of YwqJK toxin-antitoxin module